MTLTNHAFAAVFFREASFNIVVHFCESVGDAGCLDENKEGGGPLSSPLLLLLNQNKANARKGKKRCG